MDGAIVPRKAKPSKPDPAKAASGGKQTNFRVPDDLYARLESTASGFRLDVSNFLRMMLAEKLPEYERRAERIRKGEPAE